MSGVSTNEAKPELASMRVLGGGLFESKTLLCVVDAYSKWQEVVLMEKSTAESTIEEPGADLGGGGGGGGGGGVSRVLPPPPPAKPML